MSDRNDRPNIVLLMVDQWRGDCLSAGGHPVVKTPYLDDLSAQGARFDHAYSATPTCIPARTSLFTGLGQQTHGRIGLVDALPWNYPVTLAGEFTRHGYQTEAIGKMHVSPERARVGFEHVILHDGMRGLARKTHEDYAVVDDYTYWLREQLGPGVDYGDHGIDSNSFVARPWDKPEYTHGTNFVFSEAIDFLRRRDRTVPFFLFMSLRKPHPPYDPPDWAFEQYIDVEMPDPPVGDWAAVYDEYRGSDRTNPFVASLDPATLQRARAGYFGHMSHIDQQVNRFTYALAGAGLLDNTYILFLSDHGEMLGDHNLYRKGYPYEGSARIPFFLVGPPGSGIQKGLVDSEHVIDIRDVMPTLLDCAGLPIPATVEGRSVLPLARGESNEWRDYLHGEQTMWKDQSLQWVTDGHEKYVWISKTGHEQLFRLDDDPEEIHDLAPLPGERERLLYWRQALIHELTGREEGFTDGETLKAGAPVRRTLTQPNIPARRAQ